MWLVTWKKEILKKKSLRSMTIEGQSWGIAIGLGNLVYNIPMDCKHVFTIHRCLSNLHFPDFLGITKMGMFQGLANGSRCLTRNCSVIRYSNCIIFSCFRGNWLTQTGELDFLFKGKAVLSREVSIAWIKNVTDNLFMNSLSFVRPWQVE